MTEQELSLGERRVRTTFNPSKLDLVSRIKQMSAELINLCNEAAEGTPYEQNRSFHQAMDLYEAGAEKAVKGATFNM